MGAKGNWKIDTQHYSNYDYIYLSHKYSSVYLVTLKIPYRSGIIFIDINPKSLVISLHEFGQGLMMIRDIITEFENRYEAEYRITFSQ